MNRHGENDAFAKLCESRIKMFVQKVNIQRRAFFSRERVLQLHALLSSYSPLATPISMHIYFGRETIIPGGIVYD
jgi:hypothetical protein